MKKHGFCLVALLLCSAMLFCGCAGVPSFDYQNGQYVDKKNNMAYRHAPSYYEAVAIVDEALAQIKEGVVEKETLYQIKDIEPSQMLANESYEVYYAVGTTLPTLTEMAPTAIYVCKTEAISAQLATIEGGDMQEIIRIYLEGKSCHVDRVGKPQAVASYELKFVSSSYPSLYYCLEYLQFAEDVEVIEAVDSYENFVPTYTGATYRFEDFHYTDANGVEQVEHDVIYNFGKGILYDRDAKACYAVGGDYVQKYIQAEG